MSVLAAVLSIALAAAFLGAGAGKLAGAEYFRENAKHLGFSYGHYRVIGALEVAAAGGLVIGFWFWPLGMAAAIGLTLMMIGAVYFHRRAKDPVTDTAAAAVFGVLALAASIVIPLAA